MKIQRLRAFVLSTSFGAACSLVACVGGKTEADIPDAPGGESGSPDGGNEGLPDGSEPDAMVGPTTLAVAPGFEHTCAMSSTGAVKCFGLDLSGALGLENIAIRGDAPGEMGSALPEVNLGTGRTAIAIATNVRRSCAILDDHSVKCWGLNSSGQLGLGNTANRGGSPNTMGNDLERVDLGPGRTAKSIAMGSFHTCAILDNDSVKCWGQNSWGELGLGDRTSRGATVASMGSNLPAVNLGAGRTAKALSLGSAFSCALLDNNTVKCWGRNDLGQLGLGDQLARGEVAGQMGDALPAIDFGSGRTVIAIDSAAHNSCAVLDNHTVKCWGLNVFGELGTGASGNRGDEPGEMGNNWPAVPLGTARTAIAVAVGNSFSCALLDNHQVKCWGANAHGSLGLGDDIYRSQVAQLGDALDAIDFGTGRSVMAIRSSQDFSCVVLDDHSVRCWGKGVNDDNRGGWLGLGDASHHGDEPGEMGDALPAVELW